MKQFKEDEQMHVLSITKGTIKDSYYISRLSIAKGTIKASYYISVHRNFDSNIS